MEERESKGTEGCRHFQVSYCVEGSKESLDDEAYILFLDEGLDNRMYTACRKILMFMNNASLHKGSDELGLKNCSSYTSLATPRVLPTFRWWHIQSLK